MQGRRQFIQKLLGAGAFLGLLSNPLLARAESVFGRAKSLLAAAKASGSLTPLTAFKTMGTTEYKVDLDAWRLHITGLVETPLDLAYPQVTALPSLEREAVLLCPGFFTNHGLWQGVEMAALLEKVRPMPKATHVIIEGYNGATTKTEKFPLADIRSSKVFLAYKVNGEVLPEKHGYPLRVVAQDYVGDDWVKYVLKMNFIAE